MRYNIDWKSTYYSEKCFIVVLNVIHLTIILLRIFMFSTFWAKPKNRNDIIMADLKYSIISLNLVRQLLLNSAVVEISLFSGRLCQLNALQDISKHKILVTHKWVNQIIDCVGPAPRISQYFVFQCYWKSWKAFKRHTLSSKSLSPLSSVCFKTTQTTGSVGVAGDCLPTSKLRTFL